MDLFITEQIFIVAFLMNYKLYKSWKIYVFKIRDSEKFNLRKNLFQALLCYTTSLWHSVLLLLAPAEGGGSTGLHGPFWSTCFVKGPFHICLIFLELKGIFFLWLNYLFWEKFEIMFWIRNPIFGGSFYRTFWFEVS